VIREGLDGLVTLPCDTPFVRAAEVAALAATIGESTAAYALDSDGPHWLCAVWKRSLSHSLERALAEGSHPAVGAFLSANVARAVHFTDLSRFRNVNQPSDLPHPRR
jgi:molybdopterin-guanine dinucleotide biosynthesis protein A